MTLGARLGRALSLLRKRGARTSREGLPDKLPRHVAIVMDGNGRWASQRGLPRSAGHAAGTEALREIIRSSSDWGIQSLSLYAFSTENWSRPEPEIQALMQLISQYFLSEIDELDEKQVRILILGDVDGMPAAQRDSLDEAMRRTRDNTGLRLNIALNYGGKAEITMAARRLAQAVASGAMTPEDITPDTFADRLYTRGQADVDLFIRTSGEMRTSNFLPWQCAYAEMIFNPILWPDYTVDTYREDLWTYASRDRRFGKVKAADGK